MLLAENNLFLDKLVLCWAAFVEIMWKKCKMVCHVGYNYVRMTPGCNIVSINTVNQSGRRSGYPRWFNYYWNISIAENTIQISLCFRVGFKCEQISVYVPHYNILLIFFIYNMHNLHNVDSKISMSASGSVFGVYIIPIISFLIDWFEISKNNTHATYRTIISTTR